MPPTGSSSNQNPPAQAKPDANPEDKRPVTVEDARVVLRRVEADQPVDSKKVARAQANVALMESSYEKATDQTLEEAQRAVGIAEKAAGRESSLYAYTLAVEARVQMMLDRPDLARPMAEEAVAIGRRNAGKSADEGSHPQAEWANIVAALSAVCSRQEDYACASRAAKLQVDLARNAADHRLEPLLSALTSLSTNSYRAGDLSTAAQATDELVSMVEKRDPSNLNPIWITTENQIGVYYIEVSQYEKARAHLLNGLAISLRANGPGDLDAAPLVANLGLSEMGLGLMEDANRDYAKAQEMHVRRFGPAHSRTAEVEFRYAETFHFLGRDREAIEWALKAQRLKRQHVSLVIRLMPERQALAQAGIGMQALGAAVTIGLEHPEIDTPGVYQEVVRSRALVAEEMAMRAAGLNRQHDPAVTALEHELEAERRTVMELQGTGNHSQAALDEATDKMEKTERVLAERSAAFRTDERARSSDLADLRAHLPADAVLVSYLRYDRIPSPPVQFRDASAAPWYAAFVMHPDGRAIATFQLSRSEAVQGLVTRMRASADAEAHGGGLNSTRNEREYREAGEQLRKLIWDPLLREIGPAQRVFIVPDGVLNLVPFSGLPSGKGYLAEHGPVVHILSSERDLLPATDSDKKTGLLAVGGPAFEVARTNAPSSSLRGAGVKCDEFSRMQFPALPSSLAEVKDISATWERWNAHEEVHLLTGDEATRARFIEEAPESRVLHIATHAFVLDQACGNGNPLLHSGLVFAGANRTRESSVLTAQQIASLDLHGVDWAVLSACNSGYGELQDGEGVLVLERSFRVAGARSVVMALWPVDDAPTRSFMRVLYDDRFARRESTADAVWNASRTVLERRRAEGKSTHPWYWASFVGAGAWQ